MVSRRTRLGRHDCENRTIVAKQCEICGNKIGITRRALGAEECADCSVESGIRAKAAEEEFAEALTPLREGPVAAVEALEDLSNLEPPTSLDSRKALDIKVDAMNELLEDLLVDDRINWWEAELLVKLARSLGVVSGQKWADPQFHTRMTVGYINDGFQPSIEAPPGFIAKPGERFHYNEPAVKFEETAIQQISLDQNAISVGMGDRLAFEHGQLSGQITEVGRTTKQVDRGRVLVTSDRVVFLGARTIDEVHYKKLVGISLFSDGIQFRTAGTGPTPLYGVTPASRELLAASVNSACHKALGSPISPKISDTPDFPKASREVEDLLEQCASKGWSEDAIRGYRLLFHIGNLNTEKLRGLVRDA